MTVYIVSGMGRTGTSMMMHALIAGGMDAIYDPQIDESRKSYIRHDYNPNPNGYYESSVSIIDMLEDYDGKLIKIFGEHLINSRQVVDCGMRIVYMRRDPDEIALSKALMNGRLRKTCQVLRRHGILGGKRWLMKV